MLDPRSLPDCPSAPGSPAPRQRLDPRSRGGPASSRRGRRRPIARRSPPANPWGGPALPEHRSKKKKATRFRIPRAPSRIAFTPTDAIHGCVGVVRARGTRQALEAEVGVDSERKGLATVQGPQVVDLHRFQVHRPDRGDAEAGPRGQRSPRRALHPGTRPPGWDAWRPRPGRGAGRQASPGPRPMVPPGGSRVLRSISTSSRATEFSSAAWVHTRSSTARPGTISSIQERSGQRWPSKSS